MKIDPNSTIPTAFEVRVTMRGVRISETGGRVQVSTRSDFIAPELSAPATHAVEMDKGKPGWTIRENNPEVVGYNPKTGRGVSFTVSGGTNPYTNTQNMGATVIRRPATAGMRVMYSGPMGGKRK